MSHRDPEDKAYLRTYLGLTPRRTEAHARAIAAWVVLTIAWATGIVACVAIIGLMWNIGGWIWGVFSQGQIPKSIYIFLVAVWLAVYLRKWYWQRKVRKLRFERAKAEAERQIRAEYNRNITKTDPNSMRNWGIPITENPHVPPGSAIYTKDGVITAPFDDPDGTPI